MKTNVRLLFGIVGVVAIVGLAASQEKPGHHSPVKTPASHDAAPTTNAIPPRDFPVIGYIEKRDREITIKAGPQGTLYSVKTADGKILFENVSAEQLRAQAPELREFIKTAVAAQPGSKTDARVRAIKADASVR